MNMKPLRALRRAWRSWTVNWGALLVMAGYFQDNLGMAMPVIKQYIPDDKVGAFVMLVGLVVIGLRFKTTQPVADK